MRTGIALALLCALAGCAGHAPKPASRASTHAGGATATAALHSRHGKPPAFVPRGPYTAGGLYAPGVADSAPEHPEDVSALPEPVPKDEPRSRYGNRSPYTVLGQTYSVLPSAKGYVERGIASWYGSKFHGRATSNFEPYDMYQFSGAHRTLPLPSYVRVTNLDNGRSVIVRINDRGPFHQGRLIDLSYAAAVRLGVNLTGTAPVEVRAIDPDDPDSDRVGSAQAGSDRSGSHPADSDRSSPDRPAIATPLDTSIAPAIPIASTHALAPTALAVDSGSGYLQIASFALRDNAEHLLTRLRAAGIAGAALREVDVDGRTLWRVTVGPLQAVAAPRIAGQVEALGLGHPAFVSEPGRSD